VVTIKLKLYISNKPLASRGRNEGYVFTIVDLDKAKTYPQNFVCILPQLSPTAKSTSTFVKIFGNESFEVATKLLARALRNEDDSNVKAEIKKRLTALKPKTTPNAQCTGCGNTFNPKSFGKYQQKLCQACKNKPINA